MEIDRADYWKLYSIKPLTAMLTEWRIERLRNYHRTAYRTVYQTIIPEAYQSTTEEPTNILSMLPTKSRTELRVESQRDYHVQSRVTNQSDPSNTATEPECQSTINMMMMSSTEQQIFTERDSQVYTIKFYRQGKDHREPVY